MSSPRLEAFLATLYADEEALRRFLAAPAPIARAAGLTPDEVAAMAAIDRTGLVMAARSVAAKRAGRRRLGLWRRVVGALRLR
jgi:hypothetical protein